MLVGGEGIYSDAGHLEGGGLWCQSPSPPSEQEEGLQGGGGDWKVLHVPTGTVHAGKAGDGPVCITWLVIPASLCPSLTSSRIPS